MLAIASKELRCLLLSPLAWILLAVMQLLLAWIFLVYLEQYMQLQPKLAVLDNAPGVTQLVAMPLLDSAAAVCMLLVPLLSMGLFSREYQSGTITLLFSAPISVTRIVIGKYIALLTVITIMLLLISLMPFSLLVGAKLDIGSIAAGVFALALALCTFSAVGLYLSSLTRQPAVAAIGSYGVLLLLWLINPVGIGPTGSSLELVSLSSHFQRMLTGLVTSGDILYFLLLTLFCLVLTIYRLDEIRSRG